MTLGVGRWVGNIFEKSSRLGGGGDSSQIDFSSMMARDFHGKFLFKYCFSNEFIDLFLSFLLV